MKSLLLSAALVVGLLGVSTSSAPASDTVVVRMTNYSYSPATVTITQGETVEWVNNDDAQHNATATEGAFKSPNLNKDQSFKHTFTAAGTFAYYCTFHRGMKGTVVVK